MDDNTIYQALYSDFDAPYLALLWTTHMPSIIAAISQSADEAGRVIAAIIQNPNIDKCSLHRIMGDLILFCESDIYGTCQQLYNLAAFGNYDQGSYLRNVSFAEQVQSVISASGREDAIPEVTHLLTYKGTKFIDVMKCIDVVLGGVRAGRFSREIAVKILEKMQMFLVQSILGPARRIHDITSVSNFAEAISWPKDEKIPVTEYTDEKVLAKIWLGH